MASDLPVIHDLEGAAARAKVTEAVILQWIHEGLKATPVGRVGKRGPRTYRIFDSWLCEFMDRRAQEAGRPRIAPPPVEAPAGRSGRRSAPVASGESPLGPCPKVKTRA